MDVGGGLDVGTCCVAFVAAVVVMGEGIFDKTGDLEFVAWSNVVVLLNVIFGLN